MQNLKGAIRAFTILMALSCLFYLSFTFVANGIDKDAKAYSEEYVNRKAVQDSAKKISGNDPARMKAYLDSVRSKREEFFLSDSIANENVYNLGLIKYTGSQVRQHAINLGLDLKGGMNVVMEISVPEIVKAMSNYNPDPDFNRAVADAIEMSKTQQGSFVELFGKAFEKKNPTTRLAAFFQTVELKNKITFNSTNAEVLKVLSTEANESVKRAKLILEQRINKFGVAQPSVQLMPNTGRILIELPGVKDKNRVRKLLQGTANLEFWETFESGEAITILNTVNDKLAKMMAPELDSAAVKAKADSLAAKSDTVKAGKKEIAKGKKGDKKAVAEVKKDASDSAKAKEDLTSLLKKKDGKDTSKSKLKGSESLADQQKKNPLFSLLQPAVGRDKDNRTVAMPGPVAGYCLAKDTGKVNAMLKLKRVLDILPKNMRFYWGVKAEKGSQAFALYAIRVSSRDGRPALEGDVVTDARVEFNQQSGGNPEISMAMNADGAHAWKILTHENIGKCIAIVLDNCVYSAPRVNGEIPNGRSSITGNFTINEANDLVNVLSIGKLPAPARIVQETVVGPTLGQEAITDGLLSFIVALIVVLIYMAFYYNKAGVVAGVALLVNVFFIMGVLTSLGAILTLPGIAGIVLTIALSVDANILIFERVREELREGKGISLAITEGYRHAMSSILDSNLTTLILGIILFIFGSGPVQGFATTLIIGILSSLFCAIFITRQIFERMLKKPDANIKFSVPATENLLRNAKFDFVGKRKYFYIFSSAIILIGFGAFLKKGFNLGVDFAGGRTYQVRFEKPVSVDEVRNALKVYLGTSGLEVKTFGSSNQVKVTTTYMINETGTSLTVDDKVEKALNDGLKKVQPNYTIMSSIKVGPAIAKDIVYASLWAIFFSCVLMFLFILVRFKKWQYGLGAVAALFHDVLVVMSCYVIFDGILPFSLEIGQDFVAALLTVMGYSMTDTVVVFDRIREFLTQKQSMTRTEQHSMINYALNSTLTRTINTSAITFFVLLAIFVFGGDVIRGFAFALLIGVVIGTYSSLCIATPIVVDFDKKDEGLVKK
ncbi:MAG TPA: protein translocase subunit SecDF [Bacteroidia bacterium]|jgi:SecD/SecF fusion protein|nr:protein translocase subunit SecDF [Bacteroidia bacterium]